MLVFPRYAHKFAELKKISSRAYQVGIPNTIIYKRKGYAVATDEQLVRIEKVPKREFIRRKINQHTLENL